MYLKAIMFIAIGLISGALLVVQNPTLTTAALVVLTAWAFARAYYFAFYVLERYVDPSFRFSGLVSLAMDLWRRR